jgi:hypothetical protein
VVLGAALTRRSPSTTEQQIRPAGSGREGHDGKSNKASVADERKSGF